MGARDDQGGTVNGNCDVCSFDELAVPAVKLGVVLDYPGAPPPGGPGGRKVLDLCVSHLALAEDSDNEIRVLSRGVSP